MKRLLLFAVLGLGFAQPLHAQTAGVDTLFVPYEGDIAAIVDTLAGKPVALNDLVDLALSHNISYRSSQLALEASNDKLRSARGAFNPQTNSSWAYSRQKKPNDIKSQVYSFGLQKRFGPGTALQFSLETTRSRINIPANGSHVMDYQTGLTIGLDQPLLEGFGHATDAIKISANNYASEQKQHARLVENVIAQVEQAYWTLGEAEATEAVYLQSLKVARVLMNRNVELNKRGLATDLDVLTAKSGYELRLANLIDARRARVDAAEQLLQLVYGVEATQVLGAHNAVVKTIGRRIFIPRLQDYTAVENEALDSRQDLAAARIDLRNTELQVSTAHNALLPKLDLQGQVGTTGDASDFKDSFHQLNNDATVSVNLVLSEFIGTGKDRGAYAVAQKALEQQQLSVSSLENGIRQDAREVSRSLSSGLDRLQSAMRAADFAHRQLEAEQKRLDLGLGDSFRILQTEQNAFQAALNEVQARVAMARALTQYRYVIGKIADPYRRP